MAERLCPMTPDGRHKKLPWIDGLRSGFACVKCHATWTWRNMSIAHTACDPSPWPVVKGA